MNICFILYASGSLLFKGYIDSRGFSGSRSYCNFLSMGRHECCNKFTGESYWSNIFGTGRRMAYKTYTSEQFNRSVL